MFLLFSDLRGTVSGWFLQGADGWPSPSYCRDRNTRLAGRSRRIIRGKAWMFGDPFQDALGCTNRYNRIEARSM